jgi:hypothetical protein
MKKIVFILFCYVVRFKPYSIVYAQKLDSEIEYNDPDKPTSMGIISTQRMWRLFGMLYVWPTILRNGEMP